MLGDISFAMKVVRGELLSDGMLLPFLLRCVLVVCDVDKCAAL
jgi:hypothetical protein